MAPTLNAVFMQACGVIADPLPHFLLLLKASQPSSLLPLQGASLNRPVAMAAPLKRPLVHVFSNSDTLSHSLADYFLAAAREAAARGAPFSFALSGGSLPAVLAHALVPAVLAARDLALDQVGGRCVGRRWCP